MPSRTAAVKTGPVQGRRRLGLDGREHDGTLARHGHGALKLIFNSAIYQVIDRQ